MTLIMSTPSALPPQVLNNLHNAVAAATEPDRTGGESPYHYTFWYSLSDAASNVVEALVRDHLVDHISTDVRAKATGVEWWLGRLAPPYAANFEFGIHRDRGRNPVTGALDFPLLSCVMYLTSVNDGLLLVFSGKPGLDDTTSEFLFPQANVFVQFSSNLWHVIASRRSLGIELPDTIDAFEGQLRLSVQVNWWPYRPSNAPPEPYKMVAGDYDGSVFPELAAYMAFT